MENCVKNQESSVNDKCKLTSSSKWYFKILCTGFKRYEPNGSVCFNIFCVEVSSEFVCDACNKDVSREIASG